MHLIPSFQFMNKKDFLKEIQEDTKLITMSSTEKWVHENRVSIESQLDEHGAILFSDLPVENAEAVSYTHLTLPTSR